MHRLRNLQRADLLIFAFAFGVRLLYLSQSSASPTFTRPVLDALKYHQMAAELARGHGLHDGFFLQSFFYPFFLGGFYWLAGISIPLAKIAQAALGALTCALTARLARLSFGRRAGMVAGIAAALYAPLFYYDGELLGAVWTALWGVGLLLVLERLRRAPRMWRFALFGVLGAGAVLTHPNFLPFIILAALWLAIALRRSGFGGRAAAIGWALAALSFAAPLAPVAWVTARHTGRAGILPAYGGLNLYLGNNPDSFRTMAARPGVAWDRLRGLPRLHGALTPSASDRWYVGQVWDYAATRPLDFLRGLGRKALELFSSRETPNSENIYLARSWSWLLGALAWRIGGFGFPFGVLLPLALIGLFYRRRFIPAPILIYLPALALPIVLTHVCARYRMPLIPPLIALGAAGALDLARDLRNGRPRRAAVLLVCAAALVPLLSLPGPFPKESLVRYDAEQERYLGWHAREEGSFAEELAHAQAALALDPANADLKMDLGAALLDVGRADDGIAAYLAALEQAPDYAPLLMNIGIAWDNKGESEKAGEYYRRAVEADPWFEDAAIELGQWEARRGQFGVRWHGAASP